MQVPSRCKLNHMSPSLGAKGDGESQRGEARRAARVSHVGLTPSRDSGKAIRASQLRLESRPDIYQETANFSTLPFTPEAQWSYLFAK